MLKNYKNTVSNFLDYKRTRGQTIESFAEAVFPWVRVLKNPKDFI